MTPKGHAIPSKTQLLSYGTPAFGMDAFSLGRCLSGRRAQPAVSETMTASSVSQAPTVTGRSVVLTNTKSRLP